MARIRTDNVFGSTTDNPLTNVATTMNSAGLANLAAVTAPDEAIIILDPNRLTGAPEIVVVTAHTGAATSATIVRGQFGTAARQHALGTEWVHGPIAGNTAAFATAADDQGDFVPMAAWEDWTPTLTNITQGNGTVLAKFVRIGRTIFWRFRFTLGSTSAMGTDPTISAPATMAAYVDNQEPVGAVEILDSGSANFSGRALENGGNLRMFVNNVAGTYLTINSITSAIPMTWTTNDVLAAAGHYEAAS